AVYVMRAADRRRTLILLFACQPPPPPPFYTLSLHDALPISRGEAFAYERHWRRLEKDANLTRLPMPYSAAKVRVHLHEVIRANRSEEHTSELQSPYDLVCRLLLEKKNKI